MILDIGVLEGSFQKDPQKQNIRKDPFGTIFNISVMELWKDPFSRIFGSKVLERSFLKDPRRQKRGGSQEQLFSVSTVNSINSTRECEIHSLVSGSSI
jgi:hypothetical protein